MILYHYTTIEGLQGIVKSKSIWASDYRFLNDASEFQHGLAMFDRIFSSYRTKLPDDIVDSMSSLRHAIEVGHEFCMFVASFCLDGDLLSQWRGYQAAYALGINAQWLQDNATAQEFELVPITYYPMQQQKIVYDRLYLLTTLLNRRAAEPGFEIDLREWWRRTLVAIIACKNEMFKEEQEYRLVKYHNGWPRGIQSRITARGSHSRVSFYLIRPAKTERSMPKFFGSNGALPDWQHAGVDALLASQHMRLEIEKSKIPYR
jgi:hypothetical protein